MASEEVGGSFCRDDSCVITDQLATGSGVLERALLTIWCNRVIPLTMELVPGEVELAQFFITHVDSFRVTGGVQLGLNG